jgi:multiple antibiotic resistance protein
VCAFSVATVLLLALSVTVLGSLLAAPKIADFMGCTGMNVVTRVMGLMIVAIAVEFMAKGLTELFPVLARAV